MYKHLLFSLVLTLPIFSTAEARIGDRSSDIQRRIVSSNLGREYPKERLDSKWRQFPYHSILDEYQEATGDKLDYGVFWKSQDGRRIGNTALRDESHPTGWDLHVVYKGGRAVLEGYRRNGENLNQFEINALLGLHQGESHWKEAERGLSSAFGVTYERDDGLLRAHVRRDRFGPYFIIYLTSMDNELVRIRDELRKVREEEQSLQLNDSVAGF